MTEEAVRCKARGLETGQEGVSSDWRKMTSLLSPPGWVGAVSNSQLQVYT